MSLIWVLVPVIIIIVQLLAWAWQMQAAYDPLGKRLARMEQARHDAEARDRKLEQMYVAALASPAPALSRWPVAFVMWLLFLSTTLWLGLNGATVLEAAADLESRFEYSKSLAQEVSRTSPNRMARHAPSDSMLRASAELKTLGYGMLALALILLLVCLWIVFRWAPRHVLRQQIATELAQLQSRSLAVANPEERLRLIDLQARVRDEGTLRIYFDGVGAILRQHDLAFLRDHITPWHMDRE